MQDPTRSHCIGGEQGKCISDRRKERKKRKKQNKNTTSLEGASRPNKEVQGTVLKQTYRQIGD